MLPCIYTKDKKKKLKKWEEGFYKYNNKKLTLYDSDKKLLCTKVTDLNEEIDTFKYFIYIENCNTRSNESIKKNDNIEIKSNELIKKNDNIEIKSNELIKKNDNIEIKSDEPIKKNDNIHIRSNESIQKNDNIDLKSNTKRTNKELLEIIKKI